MKSARQILEEYDREYELIEEYLLKRGYSKQEIFDNMEEIMFNERVLWKQGGKDIGIDIGS